MKNQLSNPIILTLIATLFTWAITALGSSLVFFFKEANQKIMKLMLGFASGVMIAASFWSLLDPAISLAYEIGQNTLLIISLGFLTGGGFIYITDKLLSYLHSRNEKHELISEKRRSFLLVLSITLHNIPEGMAVGVAFGSAALEGTTASIISAVVLAIGIGLQNFPEGAAVSIPLRRDGYSRKRAFFYGQLSGLVEPVAGLIGVIAVSLMKKILPFTLAFAAGAMIYVVVEELLPSATETTSLNKTKIGTIGVMLGFTLMMLLDVGLK